jgi:hypothetical protein
LQYEWTLDEEMFEVASAISSQEGKEGYERTYEGNIR